jgi:hypothetical protein
VKQKGEQMEPSTNGSAPEPTAGQKALRGYRMHKQDGISQTAAARICGTTERQIQAVAATLARVPEIEAGIESGEVTLNAAQVAAGFRQHKPVAGRSFGKGDKWLEVANAMTQYLSGWKARDYKLTHVPPKEAEYRVGVIDEMIEGLQHVRADLVQRSFRATSALPSPK